jgi:hypothetical protein
MPRQLDSSIRALRSTVQTTDGVGGADCARDDSPSSGFDADAENDNQIV